MIAFDFQWKESEGKPKSFKRNFISFSHFLKSSDSKVFKS